MIKKIIDIDRSIKVSCLAFEFIYCSIFKLSFNGKWRNPKVYLSHSLWSIFRISKRIQWEGSKLPETSRTAEAEEGKMLINGS